MGHAFLFKAAIAEFGQTEHTKLLANFGKKVKSVVYMP